MIARFCQQRFAARFAYSAKMKNRDGSPAPVDRLMRGIPQWKLRVDRLIDRCLPRHCVACGMISEDSNLCAACRDLIPWCGDACAHCGLPLPEPAAGPCGACLIDPPPFDRVVAACWYVFPVPALVARFKFRGDTATGAALADLLLERLTRLATDAPDGLVPVPMHRTRLAWRGFNQAYDIARALHLSLGIPLHDHDLRRVRRTPRQTGLSARRRRRNLRSAFAWRGPSLRGTRIALVDDVMTTAATTAECARALKSAGAKRVEAWVLARATRP